MSDRPTPAEIDAGEHAVLVLLHEHHGVPQSGRTIVDRVLRAVLPGHDARLRARLDVARAVADHWRAVAVEHGWIEAGHALCCVLAALDGETDPTQLGISDGYPDADHIAQHTTIREDSDA